MFLPSRSIIKKKCLREIEQEKGKQIKNKHWLEMGANGDNFKRLFKSDSRRISKKLYRPSNNDTAL